MKYIYFYSTENTNFDDNYKYGRYGYIDSPHTPTTCAYSDELSDWEDQTNPFTNVNPPFGWGVPTDTTIKEFLSLPTTYTARSPKEFKTKYPELFI